VSCRLWQGHGTVVQDLCRIVWVLLLTRTKLRSENRVSLHVSIPERMVSCRLSLVHVRKRWAYHRPIWVPWPLHCSMGRIVLGHHIGSCSEEMLLLHALFRHKGRACLHVSFPRELVSCRVWQGHGTVMQVLCRKMWVLLLVLGLLLLPRTKLRSENRVGLHVSIPERMVSCRLSLVHVRKRWACHQPIWVQWPLHCGMGRSVVGCRPRWWAVLAVNVDRHCVHAPVPQACRDNVPVAAVCLLEGRNLELCCYLCPWRFL